MPNPIKGMMKTTTTNPNIGQMFQQFTQNPLQFLVQRKVNIPQQYQNNPKEAVQYLMKNGQMSQNQFNQLSQIAQQMGIKLQ